MPSNEGSDEDGRQSVWADYQGKRCARISRDPAGEPDGRRGEVLGERPASLAYADVQVVGMRRAYPWIAGTPATVGGALLAQSAGGGANPGPRLVARGEKREDAA